MDIGTVIKERRALLGISQQDLSDYSGVGISTIKDLERGVGNPSLQTLPLNSIEHEKSECVLR